MSLLVESPRDRVAEAMGHEQEASQRIFIGYTPRKHFRPIHDSLCRFQFIVMHRRAGKTVGLCNHIIRAAFQNNRVFPCPRYAYVGPSFAQTKDLVWGYFKHYLSRVPGVKFREDDLSIVLPNGAQINLYGGSGAYERMRGLYMDGVVMDEYALLNPKAYGSVIRPTLADYQGWLIVSGTSNGDDHFHELKKQAERETGRWAVHVVPVTDTDALAPDELSDMRADMTAEEWAREMLCSFDAPVEGAYYAEAINTAKAEGRIRKLVYDPHVPVYSFWDLGIEDYMTIWVGQKIFNNWQWLRYIEDQGKGLVYYWDKLNALPFPIVGDVYPHDMKARELSTGVSREQTAQNHNRNPTTVPVHRVEDGIDAVRNMIAISYFDEEGTKDGVSCLMNYHSKKSTAGTFTKPNHNWASHGADAFRTAAMGGHLVSGWSGSTGRGRLRRRIRGMI